MFSGLSDNMNPDLVAFVIGFDHFIVFYFIVINLGLLALFASSVRSLWQFVQGSFNADYAQIRNSDLTLPISLLVPAYNEEATITHTVHSLLRANYGEFEIVVINDGSRDNTLSVLIDAFKMERRSEPVKLQLKSKPIRAIYRSSLNPNLVVIDKENGGKADALNAGLNLSRYPLFGSIDADSIIEDGALLRLVKPFIEYPEETIAAGGIVRVANGCVINDGHVEQVRLPASRLAVMQVVEYLRAFLAGRAGWSAARSLLIISGAFGLFRKREVIEVGGYSDATDTEDAEIVVRLHRRMCEQGRKYRIVFVPDPVCWTEVPETLRVLTVQRSRWHRGLLQTLWLNRGMLFRRRYGSVGLIGMPWYVMFELLAPVIEVLGFVVIPLAWMLGILDHVHMFLFIFVAFFLGALLSVGALALEEMTFQRYARWQDLLRLMVYGFVENIGFRQYLTLIKVKALVDAIWRRREWGEMQRRGFGVTNSQAGKLRES
jgi:cellulose synthase/poly-beta-1,6-N-acetylglucosamine synthase-like glycosyltransferase